MGSIVDMTCTYPSVWSFNPHRGRSTMATPADTPSLLLTLLTTDAVHEYPITAQTFAPTLDPNIAREVQNNIQTVVDAVKPRPVRRDLIKHVAQKELYDVLYEIIEKEYDESKKKSPEDDEIPMLNQAIGWALELAIKQASIREPNKQTSEDDYRILKLRDRLRRKIIDALTPK
jgi:LPS O-antigen subunit length determinant protein (WzzB/FepE family)